MNIYLLGYMGSGKSTVGRLLAAHIGYNFIDFDTYISEKEQLSIPEIFETKGEIYFRKVESKHLESLLKETQEKSVIALGGGTPCYGNAMELLQASGHTIIYLNLHFQTLAKRLWEERSNRPLVAPIGAYKDLEDYVRKHLFERGFYYNQADTVYKIGASDTVDEVVEIIIAKLF